MEEYNLNKIFESYNDFNTSEGIDYEKYKRFLSRYIEFNKPDFVALLNINSKETVLHEQNYNLDFNNPEQDGLKDIIAAVDPDQRDKILAADRKCMKFMDFNKLIDVSILFQLRYTVTLQEGNARTFLRNLAFVRNMNSLISEPILLVSIFDVTDMVGIKKDPYVDIKYISTHKNKKKDKLIAKLDKFKKEVNSSLRDEIKLTKREKEILALISKGETSGEIARKLFISTATVNTHRQNLIKKFNVRNTSALVHMV